MKEIVLSDSAGRDKCLTGGLTYIAAPQGKCKTLVGQTKVRMPSSECEAFGGSIHSSHGPWSECLIDLCEEEAGALDGEAIFAAGIGQCNKFVAQGSLDLHHDLCKAIGGIASPSVGGIYSECNLDWCKASQGTKNHLHFTLGGYGGTCKDRVGAGIIETTKGHCESIGGYYKYAYNEASSSAWLPCEVELCSNHHVNIQYSKTTPATLIAAAKGGCNRLLGTGKFETPTTDCQKMGGIAPQGSGVWTQCELDWCDYTAGMTGGKGYAVGRVGSREEKAGYAIFHIPKHHCEQINGGINAPQKHGEFEMVACHVDWCVIEKGKKGTADGVEILPSSIGGCDDHFSYGAMEMDIDLCDKVGGVYEKFPHLPNRRGCFLDWCRHVDTASLLPGVSEGTSLHKKLIFPGLRDHCRYQAGFSRTPASRGVCESLNGWTRTGSGTFKDFDHHDCHFQWYYVNNGAEDGPSDVLLNAFSAILARGDNCKKKGWEWCFQDVSE